jgi:CRISPR-associated endonuclease/helicase Cas3
MQQPQTTPKPSTETRPYHFYWAKTRKTEEGKPLEYHLLPYHLLDVAAVGYTLLEQDTRLRKRLATLCGMEENALHLWLVFMLALHDVGKFSQTFQYLTPNLQITEHLRALQQKETNYSIRHDTLGHILWKHVLAKHLQDMDSVHTHREAQEQRLLLRWLNVWEPAIMGHHGKPPEEKNVGDKSNCDYYFIPPTQEAAQVFMADIAKMLGLWKKCSSLRLPETSAGFSCSTWNIAGFAVLCDWIGSSEHFLYHQEAMMLTEYWKTIALPSAQRAIETFGVLPSKEATTYFTCKELFGFETPSPLQERAERFAADASPQMFIIEDVTGAGKTEAALLLANRLVANGNADGFFFALPTMATANAMHHRLKQHYRSLFASDARPSLVLAHGAATLSKEFRSTILQTTHSKSAGRNDDYAPNDESISSECNSWFADTRKKAFLADVGVGTIDQALLAVLQSKHQSLRLIGMTRKVLIIDEVHANDAYMHTVMRNVLQFHAALGGSAILLSATLPLVMRQELVQSFAEGLNLRKKQGTTFTLEATPSYPWITHLSENGLREEYCASRPDVQREVRVDMRHTSEEVFEIIRQAVNEGKCVCWVRNTVRDAWEAQQMLEAIGIDSILFHARFAMCDRLRKEQQVLYHFGKDSTSELRRGRVVIATQVVEQSLDVDFDLLVSDLAPIELLIQRFGRAMRHVRNAAGNRLLAGATDERGSPQVVVFAPRLDEDITRTWYSSMFPGAAKVYPDHAVLWRTASMLCSRKTLRMPDDAREYIETAYSENLEDVPEALRKSHQDAKSHALAANGVADFNTLNCAQGYSKTEGNWRADAVTPTRLGALSTTIRLAKYVNGNVIPWASEPEHAWELSQVNILAFYLAKSSFHDETALTKALETMPDKGKYVVTLVVTQDQEGVWRGSGENSTGVTVNVEYSRTSGLVLQTIQ